MGKTELGSAHFGNTLAVFPKTFSNREYYFQKGWGWGLYVAKGYNSIERFQNTRWHGRKIEGIGKEIENGDKFGFRVDFDKREAEILFNGKELGNAFTEIPDEIMPVICDDGRGEMTILMDFLNGIARV
ncbi:MAG: hypothetical protein GY714_26545 [Desulfobacterales bacterium]|nr:hypothetical protein [Desulfobacterales bacterium]